MADVDVKVGAPALDGRGTCCLSGPIDVPEEFLWGPLIEKVYHFDKFFRTTEYECKELSDGRIYRKMVIDDPVRAPNMGVAKTVEHIKVDKKAGVVEFTVLDPKSEQPTGEIRYNILHRNPLRIEYAILAPEGVKKPLSNGDVINQQIRQAYDAWQESLKK